MKQQVAREDLALSLLPARLLRHRFILVVSHFTLTRFSGQALAAENVILEKFVETKLAEPRENGSR